MTKNSVLAAMAVTGGLFLASVPTAAQAATVYLGNITCGQSWGPYAHIRSDSSGSTIQHIHRQTATTFITFSYSNTLRTVRISSNNYTYENGSYIYLSDNAKFYGSSFFCDT